MWLPFLFVIRFGKFISALYCCVFSKMVSSLRHFPGVAGIVCNHFLPAMNKAPHSLCLVCRGKDCNIEGRCGVVIVTTRLTKCGLRSVSTELNQLCSGKRRGRTSLRLFWIFTKYAYSISRVILLVWQCSNYFCCISICQYCNLCHAVTDRIGAAFISPSVLVSSEQSRKRKQVFWFLFWHFPGWNMGWVSMLLVFLF